MKKLNIGIIGGSIAGCSSAILLSRAGHNVNVYERSKSGLIGRGGGVATSGTVFNSMRENDVLDEDFPSVAYTDLKMAVKTDEDSYLGYSPFSKPLDMHCVHWSGLWQNLRKRVPDEIYHRGMLLSSAQEQADKKVKLSFDDGSSSEVDLVLFADGYQSTGRKIMFPEVDIKYRGYLVWRGVLSDGEVDDIAPLVEHPRISYPDMPGSFVSFVVPSFDGSVDVGERTINWAAYLPMPEEDLESFMIDRSGKQRTGTIPSGHLRIEEENRLKKMMNGQLPSYYADILNKSSDSQIQLIYTSELDAYGKGRMCLIGDAGMMVQPMTGSGVFKGYNNAIDLIEMLEKYDDVDAALKHWSDEQVRVCHQMLNMGVEMEDAFIWNTIDLSTSDTKEVEAWWNKSINIAKAYSYFSV